jgi:SpoVK/Ycf46/Vps4 family AAA+-type ATPase
MTPLKIVIFNNYLKKMVSKNTNLQINEEINTFVSRKTLSLIPKLRRNSIIRNLEDFKEEPSILYSQSLESISDNVVKESNCVKNHGSLKSSKPPEEIIHMNIDVEVNTISDLLELIEKYKIEPKFHYNINMESLHKIKEPLTELNNMIGMKELKYNIVEQILYFIQELHSNSHDFMHTVIYGPPGTGKTEIAKIMGKIFSNIGLLSKDTFKKVTRSDLIAGYVGQTALKTRDVIKEALGGVLFIDEAYSLGNTEKKDSFSKECIDTLCESLSNYKQDLMVIIAGYENELNQCFFNYNQGLQSRFAWRFKTDKYSGKDLYDIFIKKVKEAGWNICEDEHKITHLWFEKNVDVFKFFGRDIESLLAKTKIVHSKRVFCKDKIEKKKIILQDLDNGLSLYLKNNETQTNRDSNLIRKQMEYSMYN